MFATVPVPQSMRVVPPGAGFGGNNRFMSVSFDDWLPPCRGSSDQCFLVSVVNEADGTTVHVVPAPPPVRQLTRLFDSVKQSSPATGRSIDTQFQMRNGLFCMTRNSGGPSGLRKFVTESSNVVFANNR